MSEVKDAVGKDVLDALQFLDNSIEEMFLDVEAKNTKDTNGIFPPGHSTKTHSTESEHHVSSPLKKPQLTGIQELQVGGKSQTIQINPELERKLKLKKPATGLDLPLSEPSLTGLRQGPPTYPKPRFTSRPKSMVEIPPSYPVRELRANIDQSLTACNMDSISKTVHTQLLNLYLPLHIIPNPLIICPANKNRPQENFLGDP